MSESWFLISHSARMETRLLAFVDLIMSVVWLVLATLLTFFVINHPELVQEFVNENLEDRQDWNKLLNYGRLKQALVLAMFIIRPFVSLILAILLIVGAQKRNYILVRLMFIISVIYIIVDLILLVPRTIYTQDGKLYVIVYLLNFVWMLYELRAVYILMTELREAWEKEEPETESEEAPADDTVVVEAEPTANEEE